MPPSSPASRRRARSALRAALAVTALVLVAGGFTWWYRSRETAAQLPPPGVVTPPNDTTSYAARGAPVTSAPWTGPWRVTALAADPADPGAAGLCGALGTPCSTWNGTSRPNPSRGEVAAVWVAWGADLDRLGRTLQGRSDGEVVVVLGPAPAGTSLEDAVAWSEAAAARLPWAAVAVLDARAEYDLWANPATASRDARAAGLAVGQVLAEHYGIAGVRVTRDPAWPAGLAQRVGLPDAADTTSPDARARAGRARDATPAELAVLAQDPEPWVRVAVATHTNDAVLLAKLAGDTEALVRARVADRTDDVAVLAMLAGDASSHVRVVAVHRLARRGDGARAGDPARGAALLDASRSPDAYVRWKAASGLEDSKRLTELLNDWDIDVRREAARRLGAVGDPDAVAALRSATRDANSFVRRWAAAALGDLRADSATTDLEALLDDPTHLVARAAADALGQLGRKVPAPSWAPHAPPHNEAEFAALLQSPDATTRKDGCKFGFGKSGDARGMGRTTALLAPLLDDADSEVRKSAAEALGRLASDAAGGQPALAALLPALADTDPDVLVTTLDSLAKAGTIPPEVRARVEALAGDPDAEIRLRAVEALAGDATTPETVLGAVAADGDERVRAAVATRLGARADEASLVVLAAVRESRGALRGTPPRLAPSGASSGERGEDASAGGGDAPGAASTGPRPRRPSSKDGREGAGSPPPQNSLDPSDPGLRAWARGQLWRENQLLHARFSWNLPEDLPPSHKALRPPVWRGFGHPDEG